MKDDHNEFELMLRFFGNEILAIKLSASNFNGKLIMWGIMIMLFTFMLMEVFGFSAWLGIDLWYVGEVMARVYILIFILFILGGIGYGAYYIYNDTMQRMKRVTRE